MKSPGDSKSRLAEMLDARERGDLALAMMVDVITACVDSEMFDRVAVVSADSEVLWHARELGALPLPEPETLHGLNEGLSYGLRYLSERLGAEEAVIFPADIPLLRPVDVCTVVNALAGGDRRVVLAPAPDNGTNALGLRPTGVIPLRFGPGSAMAHRAEAEAAGVECVALELERVAFDVDAAPDVASLAERSVGAATRGWLDARASYGAATPPARAQGHSPGIANPSDSSISS